VRRATRGSSSVSSLPTRRIDRVAAILSALTTAVPPLPPPQSIAASIRDGFTNNSRLRQEEYNHVDKVINDIQHQMALLCPPCRSNIGRLHALPHLPTDAATSPRAQDYAHQLPAGRTRETQQARRRHGGRSHDGLAHACALRRGQRASASALPASRHPPVDAPIARSHLGALRLCRYKLMALPSKVTRLCPTAEKELEDAPPSSSTV